MESNQERVPHEIDPNLTFVVTKKCSIVSSAVWFPPPEGGVRHVPISLALVRLQEHAPTAQHVDNAHVAYLMVCSLRLPGRYDPFHFRHLRRIQYPLWKPFSCSWLYK